MATKNTIPIPRDEIKESFVWRDWFQRLSDRVYGTLASQDANSVAITGGSISNINFDRIKITNSTIDNSPIGSDIPSTGSFTSLKLKTPLAVAYGGTGTSTTTANYVFAGPTSGGANAPAFRALVTSDIPTLPYAPTTSGTSILYGNGTGGFSNVTIGSGISFAAGTLSATGSGGTVTSVTATAPVASTGGTTPDISLSSAYGDTINPYASKTANYVLAAPNSSAGVPTFRTLVAADIPTLSYVPYTGATGAVDLNAKSLTNISHLGVNTTVVPTILARFFGDNNSSSRIAVRGYSSDANSSSMRVTKFRGTYAAPQAPLSGDSLGKFELAGYGTTSADGYPQVSFEGVATENWGAIARGAKTLIKVTPNTTTTQVTAVTIDQDKSVTFATTATATTFIGALTGIASGNVTSLTVTGANGFAGSFTSGATPALTVSTSITGVLKGNGTAISAAVANTDYVPLSTVLTKTADYTIANTDMWIINNKTGSALTLTFPAASSWTGRAITVKNMQAQLVNSATSNIVPIDSVTAGTAILLGVVGNWAKLVSDGTNWVIMQAASNNNLLLE